MKRHIFALLAALGLASAGAAEKPMLLVVMDPLSKELACDCVKGYAQRNYKVLAAHLHDKLGVQVDILHGDTIAAAVKDSGRTPDLIIGKHSVVLAEAKKHNLPTTPIARLTGKDGSPDQHGLIVVRKDSAAQKTADLAGYRIIFGPADCDEKSAAPMALLKADGVALPEKIETSESCAIAAEGLMKLRADVKAAAVISSYAAPLLEGCGTIEKGDIRVIGRTKDVPFITAFTAGKPDEARVKKVREILLDVALSPKLLEALESSEGFIEWTAKPAGAWNQFRGSNRDATAPWLPATLPAKAEFAWQAELPSDGIGGIAATDKIVVVSGRDALDQADFFFASTR